MNKPLKMIRAAAVAASVAVLVQGLGTLTVGPSADAVDSQVSATTRVHLRTGPSTSSRSITVLDTGQKLTSLGTTKGWTKVSYNGRTAYVASAYLSSSPSTGTSKAGPTGTVYTTAFLNLRTGASLKNPVSVVVAKGTALSLTGRASGNYSQVSHQGKTLWAATRYLSKTRVSTVRTAYTSSNLNLRSGASLSAPVITVAKRGSAVGLTGKISGDFSQLTYQGKTLWGATRYLTGAAGNSPRNASPSAPSLPATSTRYASGEMHVWSGTTGSAHVAVLQAGTSIAVTGVVKNGRTQVVYQGALRWVTSRLVTTSKTSGSSSGSLNRGYSSGLDKTNANVQAITRDVWQRFPQIKTMYGWRRDVTPDHPAGRAVDVMIPKYRSNQALGWKIAQYYRANAKKYNINYIIFGQKIWSVARNKQGWRPMADRGGDTANHYDHVHINTYG